MLNFLRQIDDIDARTARIEYMLRILLRDMRHRLPPKDQAVLDQIFAEATGITAKIDAAEKT